MEELKAHCQQAHLMNEHGTLMLCYIRSRKPSEVRDLLAPWLCWFDYDLRVTHGVGCVVLS